MALLMSVLLLISYALRGSSPDTPLRTPHPRDSVKARYLVEWETPQRKVRIENHGQWGPGRSLTATELQDLRLSLQALPDQLNQSGETHLRYYNEQGAHDLCFAAAQSKDPHLTHVLELLRLYCPE